jgi:DNA-binding NtrC family response regulator
MSHSAGRILFIDDEEGMCRMAEAVLRDEGFEVSAYTSALKALDDFKPGDFDVVISDIKMPEIDGLAVLERLRATRNPPPVIMITAFATVDTSIQALRKGAYDMLTKPFEPNELIHRVNNALKQMRLESENAELKDVIARGGPFASIVGESQTLRNLLEMARKVAERDLPVLISGESGTGKELVARVIHDNSPRCGSKFVAINCGALPQTLLESELFGVKKGAFTGADEERIGLVQAADGGTLFLDEVGNLPLNVQKLLLRFLQEKEFYRLGDTTPIRVDLRIVAATNADLLKGVDEGTFREDLYYRLAVSRLKLPPLRDRLEDVALLVAHFIREQNEKFPTSITGITPEALSLLKSHEWPGNVRQLKNVIDTAMALEGSERITPAVLEHLIDAVDVAPIESPEDYASSLSRFEATYFGDLLFEHDGNVEAASEKAGVNLATLYRKIKKYNLKR